MKKIIKSKIFLIVILCIISCGIGVYAATTYKASDVVYNASDGTSMNVSEALNDLYDKSINNSDLELIYDAMVSKGVTPSSKKAADIVTAIKTKMGISTHIASVRFANRATNDSSYTRGTMYLYDSSGTALSSKWAEGSGESTIYGSDVKVESGTVLYAGFSSSSDKNSRGILQLVVDGNVVASVFVETSKGTSSTSKVTVLDS